MKKELKYIVLCSINVIIFFGALNAFSQNDTTNYYNRNLYELANVTITSENKTTQNISDAPSTIRIITDDQIKANAYFTLDEVLAELPGFQFRNIMGFNSYIFMRGLPRQNNSILILIDGIQINELNSGGFYGGGQYNLANVKRIEVIYGPASVIYGTNAISGIINLITKDADNSNEFVAQTAIGNFNTYLGDFTYSYSGNKLSLQLSGMFKTSEKADLSWGNNDNYWDDHLEIFENDYAFDAKVQFGNLTSGINYQYREASSSSNHPTINTIHKGYGSSWNLQLINVYLKHQIKPSEILSIQTSLYNRNARVPGNSIWEVTDNGQVAFFRPNNLLGIESVFDFNFSRKFNVVSGVFGHYESLAEGFSITRSTNYYTTPPKPESPDLTNNSLIGIFLQTNFHFLKYWQLTAGSRIEYSSSYKEVLTPRFTLAYIKKKIAAKFIYGEAYRAPKPWDFTDGIGNPDLKPEIFNSFEINGSYYFSKNLKLSASLYKNTVYHSLAKVTNTQNETYYWDNLGKLSTNGAELEINFIKNNINIFGNYTYNYSYDDSKTQIAEIAKHTANIGFNYLFSEHLNWGLRIYYLGKRKNPKIIQATGNDFVEPSIVLNSTFSLLDYKNATVQLIFKNITNTEYYHTSNRVPDRYRQAQFSLLLKLSYKFTSL